MPNTSVSPKITVAIEDVKDAVRYGLNHAMTDIELENLIIEWLLDKREGKSILDSKPKGKLKTNG